VLELRDKRLDQEEVLTEFQKSIEELDKVNNLLTSIFNLLTPLNDPFFTPLTHHLNNLFTPLDKASTRHQGREKQIDKDLTGTDLDIQRFQNEKQQKLNELDVVVILSSDQIRNMLPDANEVKVYDSAVKQATALLELAQEGALNGAGAGGEGKGGAEGAGESGGGGESKGGASGGAEAGGGGGEGKVSSGGGGNGASKGGKGEAGLIGIDSVIRADGGVELEGGEVVPLPPPRWLPSHVDGDLLFGREMMIRLRKRIHELDIEITVSQDRFKNLHKERRSLKKEKTQVIKL
jgi:hypothetical protein